MFLLSSTFTEGKFKSILLHVLPLQAETDPAKVKKRSYHQHNELLADYEQLFYSNKGKELATASLEEGYLNNLQTKPFNLF